MTTEVDKLREEILSRLDAQKAQGATVNIIPGEGTGKSSCSISRGAKGGVSYEVKVYSNDLTGITPAVSEALQQARRIDYELLSNGEGVMVPKEDIDEQPPRQRKTKEAD